MSFFNRLYGSVSPTTFHLTFCGQVKSRAIIWNSSSINYLHILIIHRRERMREEVEVVLKCQHFMIQPSGLLPQVLMGSLRSSQGSRKLNFLHINFSVSRKKKCLCIQLLSFGI